MLISCSQVSNNQQQTEDMCIENLIYKIHGEVGVMKIDTVQNNLLQSDSEFQKWIKQIESGELICFQIRNNGKHITAARSHYLSGAGLGSSYYSWFVKTQNHTITFRSLGHSPHLIFLDKNQNLNFMEIEYNEDWAIKKDWSEVKLNLIRKKLSQNGQIEVISEETKTCR